MPQSGQSQLVFRSQSRYKIINECVDGLVGILLVLTVGHPEINGGDDDLAGSELGRRTVRQHRDEIKGVS